MPSFRPPLRWNSRTAVLILLPSSPTLRGRRQVFSRRERSSVVEEQEPPVLGEKLTLSDDGLFSAAPLSGAADRLAAGRRRPGKIFARGQALRTYKVKRPVRREVLIPYNAML